MTRFVNLTPHALTIDGAGTIESSGNVARVTTTRVATSYRAGVRIIKQSFGIVEGLPDQSSGVIYIVSGMVLDAMKKQGPVEDSRVGVDVFAPDTGYDAVRANGQIVSVKGLVC